MLTSESNLEKCCNKKKYSFSFFKNKHAKKGKLVFKNQIEQGRGKIYGDVNMLETCEYLKFASIIRSY